MTSQELLNRGFILMQIKSEQNQTFYETIKCGSVLLRRIFCVKGVFLLIVLLCGIVLSGACAVSYAGDADSDGKLHSLKMMKHEEDALEEGGLPEHKVESFNGFIVYLRNDDYKKGRLLVCDVALELNKGMDLTADRVKLRKIIYKITKELSGKNISALPEVRKQLKKQIKIRLNNFMGGRVVKKVLFTRFILL